LEIMVNGVLRGSDARDQRCCFSSRRPQARAGLSGRQSRDAAPPPAGRSGGRRGGDSAGRLRHRTQLLVPQARQRLPASSGGAGVSGQFNQQQQEIRALRQGGFRGDFFAQLELARATKGQRAVDKNLEDPVEAAVWYAMALANAGGYSPIAAYERRGGKDKGPLSRFDDCRAFERHAAYGALDRLLSRMSTEEREKVRNRVIYILSTQGADGYRALARMHDGFFGPFGEPSDNLQAIEAYGSPKRTGAPAALDLFRRNDVDAYLYNYLAVQTGDVSAYVMLKDFERSSPQRASYGGFVETKAKRWIPPYEFYPPESPDSGVPHSDESDPSGDAKEAALARLPELPFVHIGEALAYLRVIPSPLLDERMLSVNDAQTFQAMIGRPITGRLTASRRCEPCSTRRSTARPRPSWCWR
jgi:TPR repeat protein